MASGVECFSCKKPIDGVYITAFGHEWHKEHLTCRVCKHDFTDRPMYEGKDSHPYCKQDYIQTFAPKCERCRQPIVGKVLHAMSKIWHPHHFTCAKCDTPLVGKGKYGVYKDQPYCGLHTPVALKVVSKEEEEQQKIDTKKKIQERQQNLLSQIDLVSPDPVFSGIEWSESDPMDCMGSMVEAVSLEGVSDGYDLDIKRAAIAKAIASQDFKVVRALYDHIADQNKGNRESKSAGIQTLCKLGDIEPTVYRICALEGAISTFVRDMIGSKNLEATYLSVTFLGKMCSYDPLPESQFQLLDDEFIDSILELIIQYDVEDDGEPENVQMLMVSRACISCLVGMNSQFSNLDNKVIARLLAHPLCTTLASRILTNFNEGLDEGQLRCMVKVFNDVFDSGTGLFFSSDLKVVVEICIRNLQDLPERPIDMMRRTYLDLLELFFKTGNYKDLDFHRVADLRVAIEALTHHNIIDPYLPSRCNSLIIDYPSIFS